MIIHQSQTFFVILHPKRKIRKKEWVVFLEQSQRLNASPTYYGTDYNSHLGTKRGGLATYAQGEGFMRSIHNLESSYFRTKFESELPKFKGSSGIGIISDTDRSLS